MAPPSGALCVVGGGVRSGKSRFALHLARQRGPKRAFIATAQAFDDEMRTRIARHQRERADEFDTVEEPFDLAAAVAGCADHDVIVVDCLTLWLSNLLLRGDDTQTTLDQLDTVATTHRRADLIIVTNEVGMGVVPESQLGRAFRDLTGLAHQRLSNRADELYLAALGTILRLRPEPLTTMNTEPTS